MQTNRLYLRERTNELYQVMIQESTKEQLLFLGLDSIDELNVILAKSKELFEIKPFDFRLWDIIEKSSGKMIGNCGFHHWEQKHERAELGYFLNENRRNQGLMTEALKTVIDFGFNSMNLNRVEAFINPDNIPSLKVIQHLGFTEEGRLREHYKSEDTIYDSLIFGLLKSEYLDRKIKS